MLLLLPMAAGLLGLSYIFMLPVAAEELGIGAGGLGTLLAASGVGGLIAGLFLERVQRRIGHGRAFVGGLLLASRLRSSPSGSRRASIVAAVALGSSRQHPDYASADVTLISRWRRATAWPARRALRAGATGG